MYITKAVELFRRFPITTAFSIAACEAVRATLDPHRRATYSQAGEDRVLAHFLGRQKTGFYVDVGCHHPFVTSNTLSLYARGWSGIAIDGNENMIRLFKRHRPLDKAVCAVVSETEAEVTFSIASAPEMSTASVEFEERWLTPRSLVTERQRRQAVRLQTILEECDAPRHFDLLNIDCEGHDLEVLSSVDLDAFRPRLILIEIHGFSLQQPNENEIYGHLVAQGYRLAGFNVFNGIFVDNQDSQR